MPAIITTQLKEKSSGVFTIYFWDEDGAAVTPNTATWTLMDESGTIINSRSAVSLTPATSVDITVKGNDLAFQTGESRTALRWLRIDATYDSGTESDLPLKDHVQFTIVEVKGVT
jgi:hypothetical protein